MSYTTYLRWGVLTGLFLTIISVPFIVATGEFMPAMFFPYITGKNFIFRILVELTFLLYILLALREPKYRPRTSLIMWAVLAFVVWMALATALSVDPVKSFWSNFERMEGYVTVLHYGLYFMLLGAMLSVDNLWQRFFNFSIGASVVMGCYALLQLFGTLSISSQSGLRLDTTFGNATYLAVYMLLNFFITLFMLARERRVGMQAVYGVALVLQFVGLFFTQTRGALLGLVGGLVIAALWIAIRGEGERKGLRKIAIGGLGLIVVIVGLFFALKNTSVVQSNQTLARLASISLEDKTTRSRLDYIWPMALKGIAERPLTGWGQENFSYVFNKYYEAPMYDQEQWFDRAHNQFLDWFIAGGVPAGILYFSFYVLAAWAILRSKLSTAEQATLFGLLAGYAFNNLFVFDNLVSAMYFFMLLAFAHSLSRRELPARVALSRPVSDQGIAIAAPIAAVVILVGGWALNAPGFARAMTLVQAIQSNVPVKDAQGNTVAGPKDPSVNYAEFSTAWGPNAWPGNPIGKQEVAEQIMQYTAGSLSSVTPQLRQDFSNLALGVGKAMLAQRQHDARLELFMGTLTSQLGMPTDALAYLKASLADSPKKQQILFQLGVLQLQTGDKVAALQSFKTAFDADPSYDTARILYAGGYYYNGDVASGDKLLTDKFGSPIVDNDQLLRIYMDTKMYDRAAGIWKVRLQTNPNDANLHINLAQVYFLAGNNTQTIAELREAARINPNQAAQIEQIIKQIQDGTLKP
jgi:O-antigen ligase/Flp pilus assembly protein TadD